MGSGPVWQNGRGCTSRMKFNDMKLEVFFAKPKDANTILFLEPNVSVLHAVDKGREPMTNKQTLLQLLCDIQLAISCCLNPSKVNDSKPSTAMAYPDVDS